MKICLSSLPSLIGLVSAWVAPTLLAACMPDESSADPTSPPFQSAGTANAGTSSGGGSAGASPSIAGSGGTGAAMAGTGGGGAGAGGASGSGGSSSGSGGGDAGGLGGGGSGGASSAAAFSCAAAKPASATITDFSDLTPKGAGFTVAAGLAASTFVYGPIALADASGALNAKAMVNDYMGFGLSPATCTDASAYKGVSFTVKGSTSRKLNFRIQTNSTYAISADAMKGACVVPPGKDPYPYCRSYSIDLPVTAEAKTWEIKFTDLKNGAPASAPVTGADIVGLEWAFEWFGMTDVAYAADVTIDDVSFIE